MFGLKVSIKTEEVPDAAEDPHVFPQRKHEQLDDLSDSWCNVWLADSARKGPKRTLKVVESCP